MHKLELKIIELFLITLGLLTLFLLTSCGQMNHESECKQVFENQQDIIYVCQWSTDVTCLKYDKQDQATKPCNFNINK